MDRFYAHTHPDFPEAKHRMVQLSDCWAKTDPESGLPCLSVRDHCLTVGAVASVLVEKLSQAVKRQLPKDVVSLIAAHDLGKLTPGFQLKSNKWTFYDFIKGLVLPDNLCTNHALISQWHLAKEAYFQNNRTFAYWLISTGGHHGRYPHGLKYRLPRAKCSEGGCDLFVELRKELLCELINTFGPLPNESGKKEEERIHLLTGFTIFADWIGSNTEWYTADHPMELDCLRETAENALNKLKWKAKAIPGKSFGEQFNPHAPNLFKPREIQSALLDAADSPGLYIVEAPMGMGKTEAALSTAYKRWTEGEEKGIYFALPTQLTSNKINERLHEFLENTVENETVHSLIHGTAWLQEGRSRQLVGPAGSEAGDGGEEALRWYGSTRKQLLAPYGTGTIDQALLAVLPARFAALRYFALSGKVVVIDEVHSFDPYMSVLIDRLVRYLMHAGCTVIILSATLTASRRRQLIEAAGASEEDSTNAYPLITKVAIGAKSAMHYMVSEAVDTQQVHLEHQMLEEDTDAYWQSVAEHTEAGANVVIIRNTVALAQQTYLKLKSFISEKTPIEFVGLVHSRFPQSQRDESEGKWTGLLGKDPSKRPSGSLLISTQIVEQSVDIDADLLITDLAPVDLILQRIGRLHRHKRPRPEGYEKPVCHILHPIDDWTGSAQELKAALSPHQYIYPAISLWRSAVCLSDRASIALPGDIRSTLEAADVLCPVDETESGLCELFQENENARLKQTGTAKVRGVFDAAAIDDNEGTETRYGMQATAQLVLLKTAPVEQGQSIEVHLYNGSRIKFQGREFSFPFAKMLQEEATRIPLHLVREQVVASPDWLRRHMDSGVLAIVPEDGSELEFIHGECGNYRLNYRKDLGITYDKHDKPLIPMEETEEDFWY